MYSGAMEVGDTCELHIGSLGFGGAGVSKDAGPVIFVPRGVPGDTVLVKIRKLKKRYGSGEIVQLLDPSPLRVDPKCVGFLEGCGGGQWLHVEYKEQLYYKSQILRESMKRIGRVNVKVDSVRQAAAIHGCRNKFSVRRSAEGAFGLCREHSREVIPFADCRMEMPAAITTLRSLIAAELPSAVTQIHIRAAENGKSGVCLFTDAPIPSLRPLAKGIMKNTASIIGISAKLGRRFSHLTGRKQLIRRCGDIEFEIPHGSFFQTHYQVAEELMKTVVSLVDGSGPVLDLYCGVGFFSVPIARHGLRVHGVEGDPGAIKAAETNAAKNGAGEASFTAGDIVRFLPSLSPGEYATAVLDPPRSGCGPGVLEELMRIAPKRIVYVSCAPDTLARDIGRLNGAGYVPRETIPFDMFPQTYHAETVTLLERSDPA